jgi:hypothetical protein
VILVALKSWRLGNVVSVTSTRSALGDKSGHWNMPDEIAGAGRVLQQISEVSYIPCQNSTHPSCIDMVFMKREKILS